MNCEYYSKYSYCLNRNMELNVYGYGGEAILVFPSQNGRFFDFENNGMVESVSHLIDVGKIQLFCCDSIDLESWSESDLDVGYRTYMIEQYYHYIVDELLPFIHNLNKKSVSGIYTTGCSMGAMHAANFMFRRPDLFKGTIALSGYYDSDLFFGDYHDDILYLNSPIQYIHGMSYDHPYVEMYRHHDIVLCCGQGAWESDMVRSTLRMKELLEYKDVSAWIDFWGYDVSHDWPWWRIQFPYFIERVI